MSTFAKLVEQCGFGQAVVLTASKQSPSFFSELSAEQWWEIYKAAPPDSDLRKASRMAFLSQPEAFNSLIIKFHVQDMTVAADQAAKEKELLLVLAAHKAETTEQLVEIVGVTQRVFFWACFQMSMDMIENRLKTFDELKAVYEKVATVGFHILADKLLRKLLLVAKEFDQVFKIPSYPSPGTVKQNQDMREFNASVLDKLQETATTPQQWGALISRATTSRNFFDPPNRRVLRALDPLLSAAKSVQDLQLEVLSSSISQSGPLFGLPRVWKLINARALELAKTVEDHVDILEIRGLPDALEKKLRRRLEKLPKTVLQRVRCLRYKDKGYDKELQSLARLASSFEDHKAIYDNTSLLKRPAEPLARMVATASTVEHWLVVLNCAEKGSALAQTASERIAALIEV